MDKFLVYFFFIVIALAGCSSDKNTQIKGTLSGTNNEMIYLQELGVGQTELNDSLKLSGDGSFAFKHKINQPTFYSLMVNQKNVTLLAQPGEKIIISGDARHLPATYSVDGSEDSKQIRRLAQRLDYTVLVGDSLNKALQRYVGNRNFVNIQRQFEWNYINEVDSLRAYNIRFINSNPQSLVIIYSLYQQLGSGIFLFNREEDIRFFRMADSLFYKKYPKVSYVKSLHANVMEMNEQYRIRQLNRMLSMLGKQAPEIALPSPEGKTIKLSSYKGKYVLLSFWASWSAPCREENLYLAKLYDKYKNKGFEIFQVSLDQSRSSWERAIKEDGLSWVHVSDLKLWDSEVLKTYDVETIPANFLIDKDGTIISKELHGDALEKKLEEFLSVEE